MHFMTQKVAEALSVALSDMCRTMLRVTRMWLDGPVASGFLYRQPQLL